MMLKTIFSKPTEAEKIDNYSEGIIRRLIDENLSEDLIVLILNETIRKYRKYLSEEIIKSSTRTEFLKTQREELNTLYNGKDNNKIDKITG